LFVLTIAFVAWIATSNWKISRQKGSARIIPRFRSEILAGSGNRQIVLATIIAAVLGSTLTAILAFLLR